MEKIRINNYSRKVEVNDDGEYITLNVADQSIPVKVLSLVNEINKFSDEITTKLDNVKDDKDAEEANNEIYKFNVFMKNKVDDIFGKDTCRKVFGDIVAPFELYIDFFDAVTPFFTEYADERKKRLSKYSPDRVGSAE